VKPFGWFKNGSGRGHRHSASAKRALSEFHPGETGVVRSNPDLRTTELGFAHGTRLEVLRNDSGDESLIVVIGDSRFAVPRAAAMKIIMCSGEGRHHHRRGRGRKQCSET
jgi:Fe2+ transport system protein FeoA